MSAAPRNLRYQQRLKARKTASLIPFPAARRVALVRKAAARMAKLAHEKAEAHLRRQLEIQAEVLLRRGFAEDTVEAELRALQSAVRAALWRCVLTPDETSPGGT